MGADTIGKIYVMTKYNNLKFVKLGDMAKYTMIFSHCTRRGFGGGAMRSRDNRDNDRRRPY